jgi:hypothetical protein
MSKIQRVQHNNVSSNLLFQDKYSVHTCFSMHFNNYFIKKNYKENQWPPENALLQKMFLDNDEGQHIDKGKLNKCKEKLVCIWKVYRFLF